MWVINTKRGSEFLCGLHKYTEEGQTYKIPCSMKCGDKVKLTVRGEGRDACIFLTEINAFGILAPGSCQRKFGTYFSPRQCKANRL